MVCNVSTYSFNSFLTSSKYKKSLSSWSSTTPIFNVFSSSFKNSFLFEFLPWSSKQPTPKSTLSNLDFTTSKAAFFSLTKSTVLPIAINSAIKFTIVCDLPVPGGPSTTRFFPNLASSKTASWDESASKTLNISVELIESKSNSSFSENSLSESSNKSLIALSSIADQLDKSKSLNITNFLKLKLDR